MRHSFARVTIASRRAIATALALSIAGLGVIAAPAAGGSGLKVPKKVQITDPAGDANFLNSQGGDVPIGEDNPTPADLSAPDILSVWFTRDAKSVAVHIQTEAPPSAQDAYKFAVTVNPESADGCLFFEVFIPGTTWVGGTASARLLSCQDGDIGSAEDVPGRLKITELTDGSGVMTATFPRWASRALADGEALKSPSARSQLITGSATGVNALFLTVFADRTKPGKDYAIRRRAR